MSKDLRKDVAARFVKDIAQHVQTTIRDDGVERHIRFRRPGTVVYGFDLITWPGHLCYTGDMGTYVFSRIQDMFDFFRGDRINPGYWQEKALAVDRTRGIKKFDPDRFREQVWEWMEEASVADRDRLDDEVLRCASDGAEAAYRAAMDFTTEDGRHPMQDFWEADCTEWDHGFLWACHAIQWGIARYDEARKGTAP